MLGTGRTSTGDMRFMQDAHATHRIEAAQAVGDQGGRCRQRLLGEGADELKPGDQPQALEAAAAHAAKHTAALAQVQLTSALTGIGIPELRAHRASLADFT